MKELLLAFGCFVACASLANAHAFLDSAEPAVGSALPESPSVVKIWFTRKLARAGSKIEVFDAKGVEVDLRNVQLDPADSFLMFVSVARLPKGTYKIVWNAVCLDTHRTTGTFTFDVTGQ